MSLQRGECTTSALTAGVNLILVPETFTVLSAASLLSVSGRCKALDSSGDGYGRGEGCIAYMFLPQVRHDCLAVVSGSAVNQDGLSSSLTAPHGPSQQAVISKVGHPCLLSDVVAASVCLTARNPVGPEPAGACAAGLQAWAAASTELSNIRMLNMHGTGEPSTASTADCNTGLWGGLQFPF